MSIAQNHYLYIPNNLTGFQQTGCEEGDHNSICLSGIIQPDADKSFARVCPHCQYDGVIVNNHTMVSLRHLPIGRTPISIKLTRKQYICPHCHRSFQENIPFKAKGHFITKSLLKYIEGLLSLHLLTISGVAKLTSVHPEIIKSIDKHRLQQQYRTVVDKLGQPVCCYRKTTTWSQYLGIDEFSLHKHHQYATIITNLDSGEVLYVARGRKKQVVYDFMRIFGDEFMRHVVAISCDMNSDYEEAFKDKYPHLEVIYDFFHIVKNLNDHIINPLRREALSQAVKEHNHTNIELLKHSKYLLMANQEHLQPDGKKKLDAILNSNKLLFTAELIKDQLKVAYDMDDVPTMLSSINSVCNLCTETENKHFLWFQRLLQTHLDGIIMHAKYHISTGKVEGLNNKIKTMRRQAYGFHDDEYFFLKILDTTNKSHRNVG